jgi:hypothetical protein
MKYKIGSKERADKLGMKGREYLTYLTCSVCKVNKWVRKGYEDNYTCTSCVHRESIKPKNMNKIVHKDTCKCHKCRIGKGYFTGKNNPMWKGGIRNMKSGYVYEYVEPESKFSCMVANGVGRGYVAQHRLVMAKSIDRPLLRQETVHHKNGIKNDNRIENLELWKSNHNSGQRLEDQIVWAIKILEENNFIITKKQNK